MGFNRPSDILFMFGIFAIIMLVVGMGITSIQENQNITVDDSYFVKINQQATQLQNITTTVDNALTNPTGQSEDPSEQSIIVAGFNSILSLGEIFTMIEYSFGVIADKLGVPVSILTIITTLILVTFAVVTYSWLRGANV